MRTITTLQEPDEGRIRPGDIDVLNQIDEVGKTLGYLPQEIRRLSEGECREPARSLSITQWHCRASGAQRSSRRSSGRRTGGRCASGSWAGTRWHAPALWRRRGAIGEPEADDPEESTAGLDPAERVPFPNLVSDVGETVVVLLSTHIVEEVSELCTRMAIIDRARSCSSPTLNVHTHVLTCVNCDEALGVR